MSKITSALEKVQKLSRSEQTSSGPHSVFVGPLYEKLRTPTRFERFMAFLSKARFVLIGAGAILSLVVFMFGVHQGMKIEKAITAGVPVSRTKAFAEAKASPKTPAKPAHAAKKFNFFAPAPTGPLTLQLISYKSQSRADEEINKLKAEGYAAFRVKQGRYYLVCIERFDTQSQAPSIKERLQKDGLLRKYPGAFVRNAEV